MRVVLKESDVYRELAPPAWARGAIACFWLRRGDGGSVRVLPDGCTDIIWRAGRGAVVAGPDPPDDVRAAIGQHPDRAPVPPAEPEEIGRASCRERV